MPHQRSPSPAWQGLAFRIRGPRDFWGGLALVALALLAVWATRDLTGMQGVNFGPGTAPRLFAGLLALFGVVVALNGLLFEGPGLDGFAFRGPAHVVIAIVAFAMMMRGVGPLPPLGLVPSTFVAFMISIHGSTEMRWIESLIAASAMTFFCVVLFAWFLNLPFPLWPAVY